MTRGQQCAVDYRVAVPSGVAVAVATSSGGISAVGSTLTVPAGSYDVDATSAAGGVDLDVIQDPDAANEIIARSSAGGVRIGRG